MDRCFKRVPCPACQLFCVFSCDSKDVVVLGKKWEVGRCVGRVELGLTLWKAIRKGWGTLEQDQALS